MNDQLDQREDFDAHGNCVRCGVHRSSTPQPHTRWSATCLRRQQHDRLLKEDFILLGNASAFTQGGRFETVGKWLRSNAYVRTLADPARQGKVFNYAPRWVLEVFDACYNNLGLGGYEKGNKIVASIIAHFDEHEEQREAFRALCMMHDGEHSTIADILSEIENKQARIDAFHFDSEYLATVEPL